MKRTLLLLVVLSVVPTVARATTATATRKAAWRVAQAAYRHGDYREAFADFRRLAVRGYAPAEVKVGLLYKVGRGVTRSNAKAFEWIHRAALQNYAPAEVIISLMYQAGIGVRASDAQALKWLRRSAVQGYPGGEDLLGVMYLRGLGVPRSYAKALKWLRRSARQQHYKKFAEVFAKVFAEVLGQMYVLAQGTPRNLVKSYKWYLIAERSEPATSLRRGEVSKTLKLLAARMSPAQLAQARREASAWLAGHAKKGTSKKW